MTISDLGTVWVIADVFEDDAQRVQTGDQARLETRSLPGRQWVGEVEYVYPTVNPQTRSVPVRIRLDNADGALRPDMYLNVAIETERRANVLQIPLEAVIRTGRSERVILAEGDGRFRPASIVTGAESGGMVEVLSGLAAGERIVVSSQFLLDSEASIQGAMLRMSPPGAVIHEPVPPGDDVPMDIRTSGTVLSLMAGHGMIEIEHPAIPAFRTGGAHHARTRPRRGHDDVQCCVRRRPVGHRTRRECRIYTGGRRGGGLAGWLYRDASCD